jgi:O-antigen/teichoic acid export membrane protein
MTASSDSKTIARLAVRNTLWVGLGTYLNVVVGFVSNLALTRILGPEIFGLFSMTNFWSGLLNLRPKAGLNYSAIQRQETDGQLLGTYFILNLVISAISIALSVLAIIVLPLFGYPRIVTLAVLVLIAAESISALVSPLSMVLEKELQLSRPTLLGLAASILAYAIAIGLALAGSGLWSLLATAVIPYLISLGGIYWIAWRRCTHVFGLRWQFDAALAKQLLRRGIPTGLSVTATMVIVSQFDNFLVGTIIGYSTLGFYDRAFRIAHWSNLLLITTVSRIAFVTFARVQNDLPRLTHAVRLSLWLVLTLGLPITLAIFFAASDLVTVLYTARWLNSVFFLRFLAIYALASPFIELSIWLSTALGHTRTTVLITTAQAITIVVAATPLTIRFGVVGTLIGVGITQLVGLGLSNAYIFRHVTLKPGEVFVAPLVAASIAAAVLFVLSQHASWASLHPLARLIITSGTSAAVFLTGLFLLRPSETIERAQYLWQTWRSK